MLSCRNLALLKWVLLVLVLSPCLSFAQSAPLDAIVKIYTTSKKYDYDAPWRAGGVESSTGSGVVIDGGRILTNAHVVSNATYIEVKRYGNARQYKANISSIAHDTDLALLTLEDASFFENVKPLKLGALPSLLDEVRVYGFPEGGEGLSVTQGVVSRIEVTKYVHSHLSALGVQIDAAINSGNSGGPVISDGQIVGIAMQTLKKAENIGYVIPAPVVAHFLKDVEDGRYDGNPRLGVLTQPAQSDYMRKVLQLPSSMGGVYVAEVLKGSAAEGALVEGDVILSINGNPVASDGSVEIRGGLRTDMSYPISMSQVGEEVSLDVWRNGQVEKISVKASNTYRWGKLLKPKEYDLKPEYCIVSGVVLTPLAFNYLETWGKEWDKHSPGQLMRYFFERPQRVDEEVVIVNEVLPTEATAGYQDSAIDQRVVAVNGKAFNTFKELVARLEEALTGNNSVKLTLGTGAVLFVSPEAHTASYRALKDKYGIASWSRVHKE